MDAEPQAILVARRDLARLEHPARPAFEAQQRGDIVVEAPARHMRREFGAARFDRQPRDLFGELKGVGSDVAEAAAAARARGDGARTEGRRGGTEGGRKGRNRWSPPQ